MTPTKPSDHPPQKGADHLREALASRKLTQHKIAADLGVSKATISRWLSGERVPDRQHMAALRTLLNIAPDVWV